MHGLRRRGVGAPPRPRTASPLSHGRFRVRFGGPVASCALGATVGTPDDTTNIGYANVSFEAGDTPGAVVRTRNKDGDLADLTFHLTASC